MNNLKFPSLRTFHSTPQQKSKIKPVVEYPGCLGLLLQVLQENNAWDNRELVKTEKLRNSPLPESSSEHVSFFLYIFYYRVDLALS